MAHDVFISHSSKDKAVADAICANMEAAGVRCWIAPRDIALGEDWPRAIANAISESPIMVLIFSANANSSEQISRELSVAADCHLIIIPFKIDDAKPEPGKQYYLARTHWLDAMNPPTQNQVNALVKRVKSILPAASTGNLGETPLLRSDPQAAPGKPQRPARDARQPRGAARRVTLSRRAVTAVGSIVVGIGLIAAFYKPLSALPAQLFATRAPTALPTTMPTVMSAATLMLGPSPTAAPAATADARILNPANQHRYQFVQEELVWHDAVDYCASRGGHLVTIRDDAENTFVLQLSVAHTWLGATVEPRLRTEQNVGSYRQVNVKWVTGEPGEFTKFAVGQVFSTDNVYLYLEGQTWHANGSRFTLPFVCEWEP